MRNFCKILIFNILSCLLGVCAIAQASAADFTQLNMAKEKLNEYDIESARSHLEKFLSQGGRKAKPTAAMTAAADSLNERIDRVEMMLGRVEHVEVIDSMIVDREGFFSHYILGPGAGSLLNADQLPSELHAQALDVVYKSPDGRKLVWAQPDSTSIARLYESSELTDGSWEKPQGLPGSIDEDGGAYYPFLMADGATLYFASEGDSSIGGLDIMLSRYDGEQWLEPQNVGMPYNSPYDDYMMAIDELTGVGWWATDRNQLGDKITIYMFRPNEIRENYPDETPDIVSLAKLTSISHTWSDPQQVSDFIAKFKATQHSGTSSTTEHDFTLSLGNGRIYHSLDDFHSSDARAAMEDYLLLEDDIRVTKIDLDALRLQYAQGDAASSQDILTLEKNVRDQQSRLMQLRNRIITLETQR